MEYCSTRDKTLRVSAAQAILSGLAPDGGLFVPVEIPRLDPMELPSRGYCDVAFEVLRLFLTDYDEEFLRGAIINSYGRSFGGGLAHATPVHQVADGLHALELWHGPTAAFKDYALQLMPKLLMEARRMLGETDETVILVATSGDTGGAALAGYSNIPGVKIATFFPENGTSLVQKLQMTTQEAPNVWAYGIKGNFDDAQRGVKKAFTSAALAKALAAQGAKLSSANSINWGRLVPQIVYYYSTYLALCAQGVLRIGEKLDFCVPTGNFGDIMAGWYAAEMGLPVGRLLCASNKNNVLAEFLTTGRYDAKRAFHKTSSPSMDILVSSNLERLLYHTSGDDVQVRDWMAKLAADGGYTVDDAVMEKIRSRFTGGWVDEAEVYTELKTQFDENNYLCDPHTAVAFRMARDAGALRAAATVVLSTASPFKFSREVLDALGQPAPEDEFEAIVALETFSDKKAPQRLWEMRDKQERFTVVIEPDEIVDIPLCMMGAV